MGRRVLDIMVSTFGLLLFAVPLSVVLLLVWLQDWHSPFYVANRVGVGGKTFRMVKVRSMIVSAPSSGVESTSANDERITKIGHFIRRWKIDEIAQLWNVLVGDMSLVGPRPNTLREVESYSLAERELLAVKPGITDISSIVFSDEGEILRDSDDPDRAYAELIRPWKSRLGLVYVRNASVLLDLTLLSLTALALVNKRWALVILDHLLVKYHCDHRLRDVVRRKRPLNEYAVEFEPENWEPREHEDRLAPQ